MGSRFENGPYNLLSLDGGGIRGVSELVILDTIMRKVQAREGLEELPKPCDYFHLIGGTSTGGLIAIMLGRLRMSTTEALAEYNSFAKKIFRKKNRRVSVSSQFRETTLEAVIQEVAKKYSPSSASEEAIHLMRNPDGTTSFSGRAFVCARPSKDQDRGPRRIRTYDIDGDSDWGKECKIWEAARATSAAPLYFKSISITSGGVTEEFIDPALGCNNPTAEVLDEAGEILDLTCKLGCVLSLGTGTRPKNLVKARGLGRDFQLFMLLKDYTTDSERTHAEMLKRFTDFPSTYFRFSVPNAAAKIGMAKYKKIGELKQMTETYLASAQIAAEIEKVVDILCEGKTESVTIGHVRYPNKEQIVIDSRRANTGGTVSRLFTGRTGILEKLSTYFSKRVGNTGPKREFLLYGMGGVGKTQIALKFKQMMETEKRFDRVLFVDASNSATIEECYNEIAANLPRGDGASGKTATDQVVNWMETTSEEWLLIMDNRNDDDQPVARFLPKIDKGNMLYTARPDHLKLTLERGAAAEVDKMEDQEGIEMLLKAIERQLDLPELREEEEASLALVEELGYLPLAIDQAGAYIYNEGCYVAEYLAEFREHKKEMLKKTPYMSGNREHLPVYTSFDLSYNVLKGYAKGKRGLEAAATAAVAIKILSLICFYHDQGIMELTVKRAAEARLIAPHPLQPLGEGRLSLEDLVRIKEGDAWDPRAFRDAARLLESLSIIKRDNRARTMSMHVLLHSWARDRMEKHEFDSFSRSARTILYDSLSHTPDPESVLYRRRAAPHLKACELWFKGQAGADEVTENIYLAKRAAVAMATGEPDSAYEMWEEVIRERERLKGPQDKGLLYFTFEAACEYLHGARTSQAEALFTRLLEQAKDVFPETDDFFLELHAMLGLLYYDIGNLGPALEHLETKIRLTREGGDPDMIAGLYHFEDLYKEILDLTGAQIPEEDLLPASEIPEPELWDRYEDAASTHGHDAAMTLRPLRDLAHTALRNCRATCSRLIAETLVSRYRNRYGQDYLPDLLRVARETLARAYRMEGFAMRAQEIQRENVEFHERICGAESFHTQRQRYFLDELERVSKGTNEILKAYARDHSRRDLMRKMRGLLIAFKRLFAKNSCHTLPCGQTQHAELISRLGLEENYPEGVLVTPNDIGYSEVGIDVDAILAEANDATLQNVMEHGETVNHDEGSSSDPRS